MNIELTIGNYGRSRLKLPTTRLFNAYIEESPGGPTQAVRTSRPGLTQAYELGVGAILAVFQQPGLFNGDLFTISGGSLYRNELLLGDIAYSANPQMASANGQLAIVAGGALYTYDGNALLQQSYFDDGTSLLPPFSGVSVLYNIFVYPQTDSDIFFFSSVGNPAAINAANYSSVQTNPDKIVQSFVLAEELYFFGERTTEIWDFSGALTAPFALSQGRTYARGCAAQSSVQLLDNALFWVGDDYVIYRSSTVPTRISTSYIEDRLREAGKTNLSVMTSLTVNIEGHVFYIINLPQLNESYAYDCQTQQWARWGTQMRSQHSPGIFLGARSTGQGTNIFIGSYKDGKVFYLDPENHTDNGIPMQVIVSGWVAIEGGKYKNTNVSLAMVRGIGTPTTPHPIAEMRYSDDGGRTFSKWTRGSLGGIGTYRFKATWRALGLVGQPGRLFEFLIADSVNITIEGLSANEPRV